MARKGKHPFRPGDKIRWNGEADHADFNTRVLAWLRKSGTKLVVKHAHWYGGEAGITLAGNPLNGDGGGPEEDWQFVGNLTKYFQLNVLNSAADMDALYETV